MKVDGKLLGLAAFVLIIALVQVGAVYITPTPATQQQTMTPQDYSSVNTNRDGYSTPIVLILVTLITTGIIVAMIKLKLKRLIKWFFLLVGGFGCVLAIANVLSNGGIVVGELPDWTLAMGVLITLAMFVYPEWYVVNFGGLLTGIGGAALMGFIVGVWPCVFLLVAFLVYDYISVYKTKHMLVMADAAQDQNIPLLYTVPVRRGFSSLKKKKPDLDVKSPTTGEFIHASGAEAVVEAEKVAVKKERSAYMLGFGDSTFPAMLAVAAKSSLSSPAIGFYTLPALGVLVGTVVAMIALTLVLDRQKGGRGMPGLPFLCTGAILGFLAGYLL